MPHPAALSIDTELLRWATDTERKYVEAINRLGSAAAAAREIGVNKSSIARCMASLKKRAALQGYSPEYGLTNPIPEPFVARGYSTLRDKEGRVKLQWEKTRVDDQRVMLMIREAAEAMSQAIPREAPLAAPPAGDDKLLNFYPFTDYHLGMLAWHKEAGADWDISIAHDLIIKTFAHMVAVSPAADSCVLAFMGDFMHYDSLQAVTPTHGHVLDADSRYRKVVQTAILIIRQMIDMALARHSRVHVIIAEGNHDIVSSGVWLPEMVAWKYENEPRLTVNSSVVPYYVHQHGKVMLCIHHGHLKKKEGLPILMAAMYPEIWGETRKRYVHVGHQHHVDEKEHPGIKVIQHPTLAAPDAHAARGGWLSERQVSSITYHSELGEVARNVAVPEMFG